ncbi:MAG: tetratricopeptide repeat protein [Acidobacteriota bacterium]
MRLSRKTCVQDTRISKLPPTIVILVICLVFADATSAAKKGRHDQELVAAIASRGIDPSAVTVPHRLTDEMRQWVHTLAPSRLNRQQKLEHLLQGLFDPGQLELEYVWGYTGTAVEVFEQHQANCLAFTYLFVGLARELGVPVHFLAVENVESYRKAGDLVVVSDHVAVGHGHHRDLTVYDFSAQSQDRTPIGLRRISDLTAVAMFHSNRGAETLQQGDAKGATHWLETAVALDPELANAWVNLGVARRRLGNAAGAEAAYKSALAAEPRTYSAYQNLASLLSVRGRSTEARQYEKALRRSPARNPYTFLSLGDISLNSGRLTEARQFYRRAVSLDRDDAESYAALGEAAALAGDWRTARKMLRKAQKRDDDHHRTVRLAERVETGRDS